MEEEIWLPVVGYEGYYEISNEGKVKNLERKVKSRYGLRSVRERILKIDLGSRGYMMADLSVNCIKIKYSVHRLVAIAFLKNSNNKEQVNHINGIKTDNRVENLEWCTQSENMKHAFENNLYKIGESHHQSKLTELEVVKIKELISKKIPYRAIGKKFNVTASTIYDINKGKNWKHI